MQERLARHFADAEVVVLGVRLKSYTLWHWRTLDVVGSSFTGDDGDIDFSELARAVWICSKEPNTPLSKLKPGLFARLRQSAQAFLYRDSLFDEIDRFLEYKAYFCAGPRPLSSSNSERRYVSVKHHAALYLAVQLIDMGLLETDAWSFTPGRARWYVSAMREARGEELNFVSDAMIGQAFEAGYTEEDILE